MPQQPIPHAGDAEQYSTGEPFRFRCPYCGTEVALDPHPGCCGEVHAEVIPETELPEYEGARPKSWREP